jgi:hypothetical protein
MRESYGALERADGETLHREFVSGEQARQSWGFSFSRRERFANPSIQVQAGK